MKETTHERLHSILFYSYSYSIDEDEGGEYSIVEKASLQTRSILEGARASCRTRVLLQMAKRGLFGIMELLYIY